MKDNKVSITHIYRIVKEELKMLYNCDSVSALEACEESRTGNFGEDECEDETDCIIKCFRRSLYER